MSGILFKNCTVLDCMSGVRRDTCVGVTGDRIDYIGEYRPGSAREYDCGGGILMPAFANAHAHSAMTLLRGIGEDLVLDSWLKNVIFPAEAKLTASDGRIGTLLACAEMLRYGTASCSDMYFFSEAAADAYATAGFKVNFAPSVMCSDGRAFASLPIYKEFEYLVAAYPSDPIVKTDVGIHSVYTNTPSMIREASEYAAAHGLGVHVHLSETVGENNVCINEYGVTPTALFEKEGAFNVRAYAAHCVHLTDDDRSILRSHGVTVVSCPESNLKLGSGICDYKSILASGVRLAVATDGDASNNNLNMLKEARLAALLAKGATGDASAFPASEALRAATLAGYAAQGREDSGVISVGKAADLAVFPTDTVNIIPCEDALSALLYSSDGIADMTMVNGRILYDKGEYTTIDIEKIKYEAIKIRRRIDER